MQANKQASKQARLDTLANLLMHWYPWSQCFAGYGLTIVRLALTQFFKIIGKGHTCLTNWQGQYAIMKHKQVAMLHLCKGHRPSSCCWREGPRHSQLPPALGLPVECAFLTSFSVWASWLSQKGPSCPAIESSTNSHIVISGAASIISCYSILIYQAGTQCVYAEHRLMHA